VFPSIATTSKLAIARSAPLSKLADAADLVERLRLIALPQPLSTRAREIAMLAREAAAEIERLRRFEAIASEAAQEPTIDWQCQAIIRDGVRILLPASEWLIFARLVESTGKLVTKDELLDAIYWWDPNGGAKPKIIDVFVCKLRKKSPWPITTVWARGYIIDGCQYERPPVPLPRMVAGLTRERLMAGR
jgi:DNA-binding response OmpR family regulator